MSEIYRLAIQPKAGILRLNEGICESVMQQKTELDWQTASAAQRIAPTRALYAILQVLSKQTGTHFDVLLATAQEQPVSPIIDPHRNFRAGKISWQRAAKIHEWLARNHFAFAQAHTPTLFQYPRRSDWAVFVEAHAIVGRLCLITLKQTLGLIEREDDSEPADNIIRLTQRFCFELDSRLKGVAVGFQKYQGQRAFHTPWNPDQPCADWMPPALFCKAYSAKLERD